MNKNTPAQNLFGGLLVLVFALLSTMPSVVFAQSANNRALVYRGPGSCKEACSKSAADIATRAGLIPTYVGPNDIDAKVFDGAAIWIQPGGVAGTAAKAMAPELKQNLKDFVARGGGYVGFCAGAFLATAEVGTSGIPGLGLLPGGTHLRDTDQSAAILPILWKGVTRSVYWEGGPYFILAPQYGVEVIAQYPDQTPAAVRTSFGHGRVFVSGPHPEAPQKWRDYFNLEDPDGLDADLAQDMVEWAASLH